jgi:ubiquitin C-terminal hydrolase
MVTNVHFLDNEKPSSALNKSAESTNVYYDTKARSSVEGHGLCGLNNVGNTCFMNSALQCLSNIPPLTQWCLNPCRESEIRKNSNGNVLQAYVSLIRDMWFLKKSTVTPSAIKQHVSRANSIFSGFNQNDAFEFMNTLLCRIHSDITGAIIVSIGSSIVSDLFRIYTQSQLICNECQKYVSTAETLISLPLSLPDEDDCRKNGIKVTLEDLIQSFSADCQLSGPYYCAFCNKDSRATQRTIICTPLPRVLVLQLKRFPLDQSMGKINICVCYPLEKLDGRTVITNVNDKDITTLNSSYSLCAVSSHSGGLFGGHYITMAKNVDTQHWYQFNDSDVREIKPEHVVTKNAYILVYVKDEV